MKSLCILFTLLPLTVLAAPNNAFLSIMPGNSSQTTMLSGGSFNSGACTGSGAAAICVAGGWNNTDPDPGLLLQVSADGGNTWATKSITGLPLGNVASIWRMSCTGGDSTAICAAAGSYDWGKMLVAVSSDSGNTWAMKSVPNLPDLNEPRLFAINCSGSGSSAVCVAVGVDASYMPVLISSQDGGNTWTAQQTPGPRSTRVMLSASCAGDGANAICAAAGGTVNMNNFSVRPYLAVSTDGGKSWKDKSSASLPDQQYFYSVSCSGSGSKAFCVAAGTNGVKVALNKTKLTTSFLYQSSNGGKTWTEKTVPGLPADTNMRTVSCTGSKGDGVCVAAGNVDNSSGFLTVSKDSGNTWAVQSITDLPNNATIYSVSCTGSGATAICVAAGTTEITAVPFILASTDGGNSWAMKKVVGMPALGHLTTASCTGSGVTAVCIATGDEDAGYPTGYVPLHIVSGDGGNTWLVK